jgi:hypothetical protein
MTLDRRQFLVRSGVVGTSALSAGLWRATDADAHATAGQDPLAGDGPRPAHSLDDPAATTAPTPMGA